MESISNTIEAIHHITFLYALQLFEVALHEYKTGNKLGVLPLNNRHS